MQLTIAHRGASVDAPENTLAAVRKAVEDGADFVEVDVRRTRDGALVVIHDETLTRTTDARVVFPHRAPWRVCDFTLAELQRLDAGGWMGGDFAGERVPTLEQLIALVDRAEIGLLLEVKDPAASVGLVSDLVNTLYGEPGYVARAVAGRRLVVQSFGHRAMSEHKAKAPEIPVGLLGTPPAATLGALSRWVDQVNPNHLRVDRPYVDRVRSSGMQCWVWTVDRKPLMRRALRLGAQGIITNQPRVANQLRAGSVRRQTMDFWSWGSEAERRAINDTPNARIHSR